MDETLQKTVTEAVTLEHRLTSIEKAIEAMHNEVRRQSDNLTEVKTEVKRTNGTVGRHDDVIRDLERRPVPSIDKDEAELIRVQIKSLISDKEERDALKKEEIRRNNFRQWFIPVLVSILLGAPNMVIGLVIIIRGGF